MHDPPSTSPTSTRLHHRRPPAYKSVSLRHSPPASRADVKTTGAAVQRKRTSLSSLNLASDEANPPSVSPKLLSNKNSSGESSDAGRWFESANNNACQNSASLADNEPPFFLRNSSSSATPPDGYGALHGHVPTTLPHRPSVMHMGTNDGSSTEDFRSVIDDLTVVNKKLKRKLKKYEKMYDAHLQEEKLFEVRFHGLPDHKKKELEETLRKFASELDDGATTDYPQKASHRPMLNHQNTQSSMSRFAESGYASMSASGQNSSIPSNQASHQAVDRRKMSRSAYNRQQQSIQSYLHDIPIGLLPTANVSMTAKSKKKMVVRRLEQIFAGKRLATGGHSQPMQQEEVAQSAATADRQERETTGQRSKPEGLRVARIMSEQDDNGDVANQGDALQGLRPNLHIGEHDFAGTASPDQRPTRPLDLDPHRAQVPVENMDYIRHLGFTPPDMTTGDAPLDGHGWLYLNLLINMAQLHTLNVTPEYVKDALHEYSNHLEISRDGRKIRWKGGINVTKHSSSASSEHHSGSSPYDNGHDAGSPSKRLKTGHKEPGDEAQLDSEYQAWKLGQARRQDERNKFAYTPMFFQKEESDEGEDSYGFDIDSSENTPPQPQLAGNSSGDASSAMQSSVMQSHPARKTRRDEGPMIFYTKAKFCTDLSGNRLGPSVTAPGAYKALVGHPLGATSHPLSSSHHASGITEPRGPLYATPMDMESNNGSRTVSSDEDFGFSPVALRNDNGDDSPLVIDFEASGLGGVHPEDNFSIRVRRSQTQAAPVGPLRRRRSSLYPKAILDVLGQRASPNVDLSSSASPKRIIKEQILSTSRKSLPNSILPPASFLPFDSTSSGDVDSDLESNVSSAADSDSDDDPTSAPQTMNVTSVPGHGIAGSDDDYEEASEYSEDSDDGSIDLLATARQLDPTTVRASEREYDAALADRLAEVIVAGGSAATAGGGSGFNSPDSITSAVHGGRSAREHRQSTTSGSMSSSHVHLKRTRTSDSLACTSGNKGAKSQKMVE